MVSSSLFLPTPPHLHTARALASHSTPMPRQRRTPPPPGRATPVARRQPARPRRPRRTPPGFSQTVPAVPPPQPRLPSRATPAPAAPVVLSSCHHFAPRALLHKQVNFLVIYFISSARKGLFTAADSGHRK
jgi:hypothetical protein